MPLDERYFPQQIRQFATQVAYLDDDFKEVLESSFSGEESPDFYAGLLAGLAASYSLLLMEGARLRDKNAAGMIGQMVAFLADKMEQKELI